MAVFDARWMQHWQDLVNQDSVTKIIGRHLSADVLFEFGETAYVVSFVNGAIPRIAQDIGPESTYAFALRGPTETWGKFVQPIPPPMYNDIWAMANPLHGRLKIEIGIGDAVAGLNGGSQFRRRFGVRRRRCRHLLGAAGVGGGQRNRSLGGAVVAGRADRD